MKNKTNIALLPFLSEIKMYKYLLMPLLVIFTSPFSWISEKLDFAKH